MEESGFEGINIVPLVDVMLVLLTIVLTTSTFIATGAIPVELPKAANSESASATEGVVIEIDKKGLLYLDGKLSDIELLMGELKNMDRTSPVLIRADKSIELQKFVQVMDIIKGLNFRKISLQTEAS